MDETTKAYYDLINRQQQANNEWSAQQAQKAMDYQTEMSNTAHQREVKDLIAAGLNPVLSAGGSGATTGSGIAASAGDANVTALYGLAKQAIDANMKQAEAMANQAKSVADASSGSGSSGSGSSGRGSGSGSGSSSKKYTVESLRNTVKEVWNTIFDGKSGNDVPDWLDYSDLPKSTKLVICAALHKVIPFLTTNQIYQYMEDNKLWNVKNLLASPAGQVATAGAGNVFGASSGVARAALENLPSNSNSAQSAQSGWLPEVSKKVANVIRSATGPIQGAEPNKKVNQKNTWYYRGSSNSKYRPSQSKK